MNFRYGYKGMVALLALIVTVSLIGPGFSESASREVDKVLSPVIDETPFTVRQSSTNRLLPGGIGGFGMLAEYDAPGPQQVYIKRTTTVGVNEPFAPVTLARVFDPEGRLLAIEELTDQPTGTSAIVLEMPAGQAGIYRVSISGGRGGDHLEIGLPDTDIWGVRGEMALGLNATTPSPSYLYLPRTVDKVILEAYGGAQVELFDEVGQSLGSPQAVGSRRLLQVEPAAVEEVWRLELGNQTGAIAWDGVPGVLAPTAAAAEALQGGTVEADGLLVAGPLQARVREAMVELADAELTVDLDFPTAVPGDLEDPILESLHYGKYGFLMGSKSPLSRQILDESNPYYGAIIGIDPAYAPLPKPLPPSWESFLHPNIFSTWDPLNMAAAVATPGRLNPAYGHEGLTNRAVLAAFYRLVSTQGDDLIREKDLSQTANPLTHAFFAYYSVANTFYLLQDLLDPELRDLFEEALIATGDRVGDFKGYQSNQWLHTIEGHLYTYMATGESRFLGYYERMLNSFIDGTHGLQSKFGQHPAGYYLEEFGPDGHYGAMNDYIMGSIYYHYKELPEADPTLVAKIEQSIEDKLAYQSLFWLPQPTGTANQSAVSPSSMSTRTRSFAGIASYPGLYMPHPDFELAMAKYQMIKDPAPSIGGATTFSHLINNDDWALRLLNWALPLKDTHYAEDHTNGNWLPNLYRIYSQPHQVLPAVIPAEAAEGTWTLPGIVSWKRGGLYGTVFYEMEGAASIPTQARISGGPAAFWSAGTGAALNSTKNDKNGTVTTVDDIAHTAVYGYTSTGALFVTGKERSTFHWIEQDEVFEIRSTLVNPAGTLIWRYELDDDYTDVTVRLTLNAPAGDTFINLPLYMRESGATVAGPSLGRAAFEVGDHAIVFEWDETETTASLRSDISTFAGPIRPLALTIPSDGTPVTFRVYTETQTP